MSMLAESRKKVKYSTNPRGTKWANDDDKFGQKLMEKFGWQKGKGLGANEDGRVAHVRASKKNDSKGFGFKINHSDNWISHQDDFNSLLSELNASHGSTPDNKDNNEKVISLEEKSKSAKRRVHYHKHAKWKDLSGRSTEELDCIFGRKKSKMRKEKKVLQNVDETMKEEKKDDSEDVDHGVQTIQSTQSCQEYFAMKLAQLKAKRSGQPVSTYVPHEEVTEVDEPAEIPTSEETSPADPESIGSDEERTESVDVEKSKKKKKKKSKEKERREEEEDDCNNSSLALVEKETVDGENSKKKRKKKLKEKERPEEEVDNCDNSPSTLVEKENVESFESDGKNETGENSDENLLSKKSKKKKKSKCIDDVTEAAEITETITEEIPVAENNKMEAVEIDLITKPPKKKRLKKCKDEISEPETNAADGEVLDNSLFCDEVASNSVNTEAEEVLGSKQSLKKSKKRKRTKDETETVDNKTAECDVLDSSNNAIPLANDNDEETIASPPKKKKSSKKSKPEGDEDEDAVNADGSASDEMKTPAEMQGAEISSVYVHLSSESCNDSSLKDNSRQVPFNRQDIKRSPFAVTTATKMFQGVGANVDKISGYGYDVQ